MSIARSFQVSQNLDLEVWFLSRSSDGMLAYSARDENGRGDFVWLALIGVVYSSVGILAAELALLRK